jgi:hypothetical protein
MIDPALCCNFSGYPRSLPNSNVLTNLPATPLFAVFCEQPTAYVVYFYDFSVSGGGGGGTQITQLALPEAKGEERTATGGLS